MDAVNDRVTEQDIKEFSIFLKDRYIEFLQIHGLNADNLYLNTNVLSEVSNRYLRDIFNISLCHEYIVDVDNEKHAGFVTYWMCKLKPVTYIVGASSNLKKYIYINELFAVYVSLGFILAKNENQNKKFNLGDEKYSKFRNLFRYTLKHRTTSGYTLSLLYYLLQVNLKQEVQISNLEDSILIRMAEFTDARDSVTGGHLERTSKYIRIFLDELKKDDEYRRNLEEYDIEKVMLAAKVHDVGKIVIPDDILNKPKKLTDKEFNIIKEHTIRGEELIAGKGASFIDNSFLELACIMCVNHHERWDGKGYPKGLIGKDIPLLGRVMAIVDVYDALVSERPYKPALPHLEAVKEIENGAHSQFDPDLIEIFLKVEKKFEDISIA